MPFNLGGFASGLASGMEEGADLGERYRKMAQEQIAKRAQQDLENQLLGGPTNPAPGGGAPPGAPGAQPIPAVPQNAAIPGAQPLPPGAPGATPMPPPGPGGAPPAMPPGGAGPPGANAPAPPPQAAPMPAAPPPGPQGPPPGGGAPGGAPGLGGGLPPPGSPQNQDPIIQSKAALQSIAKEIAAANPGRKWKPGELLDAINDSLEMMDKINPITKQISALQLQYWKAQLGADTAGQNREERGREADQRAGVQSAALVEKIRHNKAAEQTSAGRASTYAEMATYSHEDRQAAIQERRDQATQAVDSRERVAAQKDADTMERLDKALEDKDWATVAQIQAGEYKADVAANPNPSKPVPKPAVTPPPRRTGGGGGPAKGGAYKSAADVVAAYKAGKLTHDAASQVLRQNGWAN